MAPAINPIFKVVSIDPRYEPEFFRKAAKAAWLAGEIIRRR